VEVLKKIVVVAALVIVGLAAAESPSQAAPLVRPQANFANSRPAAFRPTFVFRCHPSMAVRGCKDAFR
jgi:hypothetical protein